MAGERPASLLEQLRASQLLEPAQLDELAGSPEAQDPDPKPLARRLLQRGWLTKFQINQVVQGRGKDLLVGPYLLLERIGEGGMGVVYKARHRHMNRVVALKVIRKERLGNPDSVRRFYQEVQAAAQLVHPNIVLAFDANQIGNTHYFAMEYVDGTDLARLVKESGPLPVAQACDYVRQAALGLQHAFERGLVHRDIKPHNLLVSRPAAEGEKGVVKILDMGLARLQGPADNEGGITKSGVVIGTPDFLAPEQAANARAADIRSDLYSLGCTFYFLLAGRPPFTGGSLTEILLQHQLNQAPALDQVRADAPPAVAAIVARLMAKNPAERFQTPAELATALAPFAQGAPVPVGALPPPVVPVSGSGEFGLPTLGASQPGTPASPATATGLVDLGLDETSEALGGPPPIRRPGQLAGPNKKRRTLMIGVGAGLHLLALLILAIWLLWPRDHSTPETPKERRVVEVVKTHPEKKTSPATKVKPPPPKPEDPPLPPKPEDPPAPVEVARSPKVGELLGSFPGQNGSILSVAFSPDGRRLLTSGANGTVILWDRQRGQEIRRLIGHVGPVPCVAFAPDGRQALTAGHDRTVRLWDVDTGKEQKKLLGHTHIVHTVAFAPDGRRAVSGSEDGSARLWDLNALPTTRTSSSVRKFLRSLHGAPVRRAVFCPDGQRVLLSVRGCRLLLWEVENGVAPGDFRGHHQDIHALALTRDGRRALSGCDDGTLKLWEVETGNALQTFQGKHEGEVRGVALSPDGRRALSAGKDGTIRLWDCQTGKEIGHLEGHTGEVHDVAFSPDGRLAASGGVDQSLRLWRLPEDPGAVAIQLPEPPPDPRKPVPVVKLPVPAEEERTKATAVIRESFKKEFEKKTPADQIALAGKLIQVAHETKDNPAGRFVLLCEARDLAAQAGDVKTAFRALDDLARWYIVDTFDMKEAVLARAATSATTLPAGRAVVDLYLALVDEAVAEDKYDAGLRLLGQAEALARKLTGGLPVLNLVEARTKAVKEMQAAFASVQALAARLKEKPKDPEANLAVGKFYCLMKGDWDKGLPLLAAAGDAKLSEPARKDLAGAEDAEGKAKLGDAWWTCGEEAGAETRRAFQRRAYHWYEQAVASLTGLTKTQVAGRMKEVEASPGFRPAEAVGLLRTFEGHGDAVRCVALSRDGRFALSGGADQSVRLWDVRKGKEVRSFHGHQGEVRGVGFSLDGQQAVSGSADTNVIFWDVNTGQSLFTIRGFPGNVIDCLVLSPDGRSVVYGVGRSLIAWAFDIPSRQLLHYSSRWDQITSIAVGADNHFAFVGSTDGTARLVDLEQRRDAGPYGTFQHNQSVTAVALSKGTLVLTGTAAGMGYVRDAKDIKTVKRPAIHLRGHTDRITGAAFLPDGNRAVTVSADKTLRVWDVRLGRELFKGEGHTGEITSLAVSSDGRYALTGSTDRTVRLWRLP